MNRKSVILIIGALSFSLCAESAFASSVTNYENAAIAAAKKRNEQLKKRRAELETEARKKAQIELEEKQRQEAQQREEARKKAQIELEEKQRQEAQQREIKQKAELAAQEQRKVDELYRQTFIKYFADNIKNCSQDFYVITQVWALDQIEFDEIKISDSSVNLIDLIIQSLEWEGHPHKVTSVEKLNDPTAKNYFTVEFSWGDTHANNLFIRHFSLYDDIRGVHLYPSAWENMNETYFMQRRLAVKFTQDDSGKEIAFIEPGNLVSYPKDHSGKVIPSKTPGELGRCSIPTLNEFYGETGQ